MAWTVQQLPGHDALELYELVLAAGGEGVVVKDSQSPYYSDARRATWRKCKPSSK
jgi:ATP-dependent DNA ligase